MIAEVGAGATTLLVLGAVRLRPDHRLRAEPAPVRARPARPTTRWWPPPRRRAPTPIELAGWCDAVARTARGGATLPAAIRSVPPPEGSALRVVRHRLERGRSLAEAASITTGTADEQAILTVLGACAREGGGVAQPLDRVAATLRRRAADAAERDVHSAQARLSATVMTILPVAVLALSLVTSPPVRRLVASPIGAGVVLVGASLNALGWTWMRRIIRGRR